VSQLNVRLFIGFLISPGAPAVALYWVNIFFVSLPEAALLGWLLGVCAYAASIVLGIPMYLILRRQNRTQLHTYLVAGALIGLIAYILIFGVWGLISYQSAPEHAVRLMVNSLRAGLMTVGYATIASGAFWVIAVRDSARPSSDL
jgi:hypothetical protein